MIVEISERRAEGAHINTDCALQMVKDIRAQSPWEVAIVRRFEIFDGVN